MVRSNRLLPVLGLVVVGIAGVVGMKACSPGDQGVAVLDAVPQAPKPDADSPADTIKTLTANVSAMTSELQSLKQDNASLLQKNQQLQNNRQAIENTVFARLQSTLRDQSANEGESAVLTDLKAQVSELRQSLSSRSPTIPSGDDIPVGLGLDELSGAVAAEDALTWIGPLDKLPESSSDSGSLLDRFSRGSQAALGAGKPVVDRLESQGREALNTSVPVYTVPRNATLIGSTAMTALVGRVPMNGQVSDPMPFKVITGKDNLAANGLSLPGVDGMVWSGTAIGDWTLSCVSGKLESVTFVFDDGTLQTLSSDDQSLSASSGGKEKSLGWISDARGIPCITGARKTNATAFLSQSIAVTALEAAGQAAAASETTTLLHDSGNSSNTVTGDRGQYILGKTLNGGSDEISRWLRERQSQNFDAVFVPAGVELAIHVDIELPIDYHPHGRRLHHAHSFGSQTSAFTGSGLD